MASGDVFPVLFPGEKRRICQMPPCGGRLAAMVQGQFFYNQGEPKGWVFAHGATREWLGNAKWQGGYASVDHSGEPFVWLDCPWCGAELPER